MKKIAVVMDAFERLIPHWDSTLLIIEAALRQGIAVYYFEAKDLFLDKNAAFAHATPVQFCDVSLKKDWYRHGAPGVMPLTNFDAIIVRKDPPFDVEYFFLTYLLDLAVRDGVRVVNSPSALRNFNEKMLIFRFPECIAPTLVSANKTDLKQFWQEQGEIVLKPLDALGGRGVFHVKVGDTNFSSIVEMLTQYGTRQIMAQRYLPEVRQGDKRIMMLYGEPILTAVARIPREGEARANIVSGAHFKTQPLTERDLWITNALSDFLKREDIVLAGIDVIGDYLTEINITSPGCLRELSDKTGINLGEQFLNGLFQ